MTDDDIPKKLLGLLDERLLQVAQQAIDAAHKDKEIFKTLLSLAYTDKRLHDVLFSDVELWKTALLKMLRSLDGYKYSQGIMNSPKFSKELAERMKDFTVADVINGYFSVCRDRFLSQRQFLLTNISHCALPRVIELLNQGADPLSGEFEYTGEFDDNKIPLKSAKWHTKDYERAQSSYHSRLELYFSSHNDGNREFRFHLPYDPEAIRLVEQRMHSEEKHVSLKNEIYQTVKKPLSSYPLNIICHRSLSSLTDYFAVRANESVEYLHPRYASLFRKDSTKENKLRVARACEIILTCSPGKILNSKSIHEILLLDAMKDETVLSLKQIESIIGNGRLKKVVERYNTAITPNPKLKNVPKM